jgi:hypothetical protein
MPDPSTVLQTGVLKDVDISLATSFRADDSPIRSPCSPYDVRQQSINSPKSPVAPDMGMHAGSPDAHPNRRPSWQRRPSSLRNDGTVNFESNRTKQGVNVQLRNNSNSHPDFFSYPDSSEGQRHNTDSDTSYFTRHGHVPAPRESLDSKERRLKAL